MFRLAAIVTGTILAASAVVLGGRSYFRPLSLKELTVQVKRLAPEYQLASYEQGRVVKSPNALVERCRKLLEDAGHYYQESHETVVHLSAVESAYLKEGGMASSPVEILEGLNAVLAADLKPPHQSVTYQGIIRGYRQDRLNGLSHTESLTQEAALRATAATWSVLNARDAAAR